VIGDLAETIPAFLNKVQRASLPDWSSWRNIACGAERAELDPRGMAEPTIRFIDELFRQLPENSIVLADVGQHQMWAAQRFRSSSPRGFITSGGLGAMGFALPAAIGVQLAHPEANVLCISGDGGIQMNIQELATVKRLGLPIKMVIIDNKYLGMVRQWQQLFYNRNYAETDLSDNPDFVAIGHAYGINAQRMGVEAVNGIEPPRSTVVQIKEFLGSSHPELLVFECPPEANVYPMVPSGASLSEMLLEEE
jgi:acetolactate synthase I/II/III large subunit